MAYDVVVVGGGIIGCTASYYLSHQGLKTALFERGKIAAETSANNFSWINATSKTSNEAYHRLNALGVRLHDELSGEFGADALGLRQSGSLGYASRSDTVNFETLKEQAHRLEKFGYPSHWVGREELRTLEPSLSFPSDAEGLLAPTDKTLDAPRFARFMTEQARQAGARIVEECGAVELLTDPEGAVCGVETEQGPVECRNVLIAAGPQTPEVLAALTGYEGFASRFPVRKVPGLLVSTPAIDDPQVSRLIYTDHGGEFHVFPEFGGGLRLASDVVDGEMLDAPTDEKLRSLALGLLRHMAELAPGFPGETLIDDCHLSVGVRAYPEDGFSISGELPGSEGLYLIATHSGITLAPALGSLMADFIATGERSPMLEPFALSRLPGF